MIRRKLKKGVILVITLFMILLLAMIMISAVVLSQSAGSIGNNSEMDQAAYMAAQAGLDYARTRLQERPTWTGDGDGVTESVTTVKSADGTMVVTEDNGLVIGYMSTGGLNQQFRIRFNWHDGPRGSGTDADGLNDPSYLNATPWVSFNNLAWSQSIQIQRAHQVGSVWKVDAASPHPYTCPRYAADIIVEGYVGDGLRDQLTGPTPVPDPPRGNRRITSKVVEGLFRRQSASVADAAIYAAGDLGGAMDTAAGTFTIESVDPGVPPRIRSNGNVAVTGRTSGGGPYVSPGGSVYVQNGGSFTQNGAASTSPTGTQQTTASNKFFNMTWQSIKKSTNADSNIKAGTYIWRAGGAGYAQATPYLEYFPLEHDPAMPPTNYATAYPLGGGTPVLAAGDMQTSGTAGDVVLKPNSYALQFTDNIYVNPVSGIKGLAILPEDAVTQSGARPVMEIVKNSQWTPILTGTGNVTVMGSVQGQGAVTAQGNLDFQGSSALQVDPSTSVALYATGNVTLHAIPDPVVTAGGTSGGVAAAVTAGVTSATTSVVTSVATSTASSGPTGLALGAAPPPTTLSYQDQAFAGIIFAGGNFTADLTTGVANPGSFYLRGVLAAYGGDPGTQNPGQAGTGSGIVDIKAKHSDIKYDSAYINGLLDLMASSNLDQTMYGVLSR